MTYLNNLELVQEVLGEYPNLTLNDVGEIVYELTSDCYIRKPVDIKTFILDPYYLGNSVGSTLFPYWFELFNDLYPHPCLNMYNEVVLSVAIGSGKTTIAIISLLYEMYKLLCLKNPYEYYGISNSIDKFAFSILAPTLGQGSSVAFAKFLGMINTSPFFKAVKATPKSKSSVSEEGVGIADFMVVHTGSNMNHLLGKLNFFGVMDEVSFFQGKDAIAKARELHTGFITRRKSRFIHLQPFMPGMLWLTSSPLDEQDYLNEAIEKLKSNEFATYYDNIPLWKVKGKRGNYLGDTFKVYLGDEKTDPYIIEDENKITQAMVSSNRIIDVPMEHFREFNENIIRAIRDVAGRRVQADISLFKSKQQLTDLFINPNRFKNDVVSMSFSDVNDKLENYVNNLDYFKKPINSNSYRFIHLDIATKKDKFGLASVYSTLEDVVVSKPTPENPTLPNITKKERMFYIDFAVAIEARKGEEINIFKVIDFLFHIRKLGYPIKLVTSDIFQGDVTRQFLRLNGTKTEYLSVDRTKEPYNILRELVGTSRIIGVRNNLLLKELLGLRELEKKFDHLANGSKDLSDAVTGALFACVNSKEYVNNYDIYKELTKDDTSQIYNSQLGQMMKEAQKKQKRDEINKLWGF